MPKQKTMKSGKITFDDGAVYDDELFKLPDLSDRALADLSRLMAQQFDYAIFYKGLKSEAYEKQGRFDAPGARIPEIDDPLSRLLVSRFNIRATADDLKAIVEAVHTMMVKQVAASRPGARRYKLEE